MNTTIVTRHPSKPTPAARHNPSHDKLVAHETTSLATATVDAIVVPTGRHPRMLRESIRLAKAVDCTLLLLCSRYSDHRVAADMAARAGVTVAAVNATALPDGLMPAFRTTDILEGGKFARRTDTSLKRNLGLLLARLAGWQRVVFLDDDIEVPRPGDLQAAAGLLDRYDGVGLRMGGFPDNSVVCHAYRETGSFQDTFIGGGALAFSSRLFGSFFPNIYNEDWFFLLDDEGLRPSAMTGDAQQKPYDPFADADRARTEEFGDCIAEGVFGLLDQGGGTKDTDVTYWQQFLANRAKLITDIIARVDDLEREPAEKRRMVEALKAARGRCQIIDPQMCIDYMDAWLSDRYVWQDHLDRCAGDGTVRRGIQEAIEKSGLASRTQF